MNWPSAACVLIIRDGAVLATKRRNEEKYGLIPKFESSVKFRSDSDAILDAHRDYAWRKR